jgi:competence protein ComEA
MRRNFIIACTIGGIAMVAAGTGLAVPSSRQLIFDWLGVGTISETGKPSDSKQGSTSMVDQSPRLQKIEESVARVDSHLALIDTQAQSDKKDVQMLKDQLKDAIDEVVRSNALLQEQKKQWEITLRQEASAQESVSTTTSKSSLPADSATRPASGKRSLPAAKVNINTAGIAQLHSLPGIGPSFAQRIIDYRNKKGAFRQTSELLKVTGIKQKEFDRIKDGIEI